MIRQSAAFGAVALLAALFPSAACETECGKEAVAECHAFVELYCRRVVDCQGNNAATCAQDFEADLPRKGGCDDAQSIRDAAALVNCRALVENMPCPQFLAPGSFPPECRGQFGFER